MFSSPPEINFDVSERYSRPKAAGILGVDPRTLAAMIARGEVETIKIGRREKVLGRALADILTGGAK